MPGCPMVDVTSEVSSGGWRAPVRVAKVSSWEGAVSITLGLPTEEPGHSEGAEGPVKSMGSGTWLHGSGPGSEGSWATYYYFFFQLYWGVTDQRWQAVNPSVSVILPAQWAGSRED